MTAFNTVLSQVPGELAPKLALALACEETGAEDLAEQLYAVCAATDANYVAPAAFGLARTRENRGDVAGSLEALDLVAPTSGAYVAARRRRADLLTESAPGLNELAAAAASVENIAIDPRDRLAIRVRILKAAISEVERTGNQPGTEIGGVAATEPDLRAAAEQAYRDLATLTSDRDERIGLVDAANASSTADARVTDCPACGATVADGDQFCESCGATLAWRRPSPSVPPPSYRTRRLLRPRWRTRARVQASAPAAESSMPTAGARRAGYGPATSATTTRKSPRRTSPQCATEAGCTRAMRTPSRWVHRTAASYSLSATV